MLPLALTLLLGAGVEIPWATNVHSEVRARTPVPNDTSQVAAGDLELTPTGAIGLRGNGFGALVGYSPTLRIREPYLAPRAETAHKANLYAEYRRDNRPRPFVNAYFAYGLTDFSQLQRFAGAAVPITPVRQFGLVKEMLLDTNGGLEIILSPRWSWTNTAGYTWGGGVDEESRKTLPVQRSPRAISRLQWLGSPNDTLAAQLSGRYSWFSSGSRNATLEVLASWAHLFSKQTSLTGQLSLTGAYGLGPVPPPAADPLGVYLGESRNLLPGGSVAAAHKFLFPGQSLEISGNLGVAPFSDPFLGTVYGRFETSLGLAWAYGQHWTAGARGGIAQSLAGASQFTTYSEAVLGYEGAKWWRVDGSGRFSTTATAPATGGAASDPLLQWLVSVGLTLKTEGVL